MSLISTLPLDQEIERALIDAGIRYEVECASTLYLDFRLPDLGVYIEVKSGHSPRISEQMSRAVNVIAIQGEEATRFMARCIRGLAP